MDPTKSINFSSSAVGLHYAIKSILKKKSLEKKTQLYLTDILWYGDKKRSLGNHAMKDQ